jgi:protein-S-isoprenylcysteine O-methyltransferase Ste14
MPRVLIAFCWVALILYWTRSAGTAKPAVEEQSAESRAERYCVWLAFLLMLVAGIFPHLAALPGRRAREAAWAGVAVCAAALAFAIWARRTLGAEWSQDVELKQGHRLIVRGPYRLVRHPIYTAHLLMALGAAITFGTWLGYAAVVSFFVGFRVKLAQEEELLSRNFPEEYPEYKKRTWALLPWML